MAPGVEGASATATASRLADPAATALEFGWVPAEAVRSLLEDVGNFRARGAAIELLHATVLEVGGAVDAGAVRATLSAFLAFLLRLVGDHNFKIAASAMAVLEDLAARLGADLQPYLGSLMAPLIERLGDGVQMVRAAAARAVAGLALVLGPAPVLQALGGALVHQQWRVREEGVNAYIAALLTHAKERFDYPACVHALAAAADDDTPRVAAAALEAFALLHARLGALLQGLLTAVGAAEGVKRRVAERARATPQLGLPTLDAQGQVQHQAHARPPSAHRQRLSASAAAAQEPAAAGPLQLVGTAALPCSGALTGQQALPLGAGGASAFSSTELPVAPGAAPAAQPASGGEALEVQNVAVLPPYSPAAPGSLQQRGHLAAYSPAGAEVGGSSSRLSGGSYGYGAAAAGASDVEGSAASCASMSSQGPGACSTGRSSTVAAEEGGEPVERSEGSLLSWVRPARRPTQLQQSASASRRGRSITGTASAGLAAPDLSAAAPAGRDGVRSFKRPSKLTHASSASHRLQPATGPSLQPAAPAAPPAAGGAAATAAPGAGAAGAYNADLYASVRNWQQRVGGSGNFEEEAADSDGAGDGLAAGTVEGRAPSFSWQQLNAGVPDAGLGVEPRSDSLLQWRLPARAASSRTAAGSLAARPQPPLPPSTSPAAPAATPPLPRIGSAALRRTLSSFKKRIFGAEAPAADEAAVSKDAVQRQHQQQQQQHETGSPGWSIAAVREQHGAGAAPAVQQQQQPVDPMYTEESAWGGRPSLIAAAIPDSPSQQQQPDSPGSTADKLNRLKRLSERRRVSSAPITAQPQRQLLQDAGDGLQQPLLDGLGADGPMAAPPGAAAPEAGSSGAVGGAEGSPGARPCLQALKVRARTARIVGSPSATPAALGAAAGSSSGLYSMEAVEDVFGPDQPVCSPAAAWSPLKTAGSGGGSSPSKAAALSRSSTGSSTQWPDSPTGGSASPGRATWRRSSFLNAAWAAGSPKAGPAAAADGAAGGGAAFSPSADASPLAQPEAALRQSLGQMQQAAVSQVKELDWQAQYEALRTARRLARHHPGVVAPSLHALVALAAPVIDALRSTLSRMAIAIFQELAEGLGPALDAELEVFVPLLLKRAGQVSIAGRDNFLAVEADRAVAAVVEHAGEARVAATLLSCLAGTKSPDVRAKAAMHLDSCLQQHGARLLDSAAGGGAAAGALAPRLLRTAVGLLDEGRLEARTAGKRMLWELRRLLDGGTGGGDDFRRALARLDCKTDKVWDVLDAECMPAPAPIRQPSAALRIVAAAAGASPASPTAGAYSPARQSVPTSAGPQVAPAARASSSGSRPSAGSYGAPAAGATGAPPTTSSSIAWVSGSKWQPSARPGSQAGGGSSSGARASSGKTAGGAERQGSRPASGSAARPASGGTCDAVGGPLPVASLAGVDPDVQQQLEAARAQLDSRDWKERVAGVDGLQAAPQLPPEGQLWVACALAEPVLDANLKVQQQALAALNRVLAAAGEGLAPAAAALVPALCKCSDSSNPSVRQGAAEALDTALRSWDASSFMPPLMAALGSPAGAARSKEALLARLVVLAPQLWPTRPALVRKHALPALFALLTAERRPELRHMVQGALAALAHSMGPELVAAAASLPPQQQQVVADIVAQQRSSSSGAPR